MSTHTYATLDVSAAAYLEIYRALSKAGYDHAFRTERGGWDVLDMSGIALTTQGSVCATHALSEPTKVVAFGAPVAEEEATSQPKTDKPTTPASVTIVLCQSPGWERRGAVYLNGMLTGVVTDKDEPDFIGNNSAERQAWAIVRATGGQARVTEAFVKWSWLESLDEVFPDNLADIHPDAWVDGEAP